MEIHSNSPKLYYGFKATCPESIFKSIFFLDSTTKQKTNKYEPMHQFIQKFWLESKYIYWMADNEQC